MAVLSAGHGMEGPMKLTSATCILAFFCGPPFAVAQTPPHAPSQELKKQEFFVGSWRLDGVTTQSPFGPGGAKFSSSEDLEWMPGGFFLVAHSYAGGKLAGVTIIGYDSEHKVFTHASYNSTGETELWTGTAQSDSWVWTRQRKLIRKPVDERLNIKKTSPTSYSFSVEIKPTDGDSWSTVAEGVGTKTK
jgi:hypothetical protein